MKLLEWSEFRLSGGRAIRVATARLNEECGSEDTASITPVCTSGEMSQLAA